MVVQPEVVRAPALGYRYLGQFFDPSGKRFVYLGKGDREVPVSVGSQLEDGYVVEAITDNTVRVLHAATQSRADLAITSAKGTP